MALLDVLSFVRVTDQNGDPIAGARATVYQAGTTTPVATFQDPSYVTQHPSPIVADAGGLFPAIYIPVNAYKIVLTDTLGATIFEADNYEVIGEEIAALAATGKDSPVTETAVGITINGDFAQQTVRATAALTLALVDTTLLPTGFQFYVQADGGDVVVDPNGTQTIDGALTYTIPQGTAARVVAGSGKWLVDSQEFDTARQIIAGAGLTGGGDLAADRTISADFASQAEAEAGTATDKVMTPERTGQAITALGFIKAWVNFNGTGTVAIRDSFNVASVTDNGTGNYTINFTNALANTNYAIVALAGNAASAGDERFFVYLGTKAVGSLSILVVNVGATATDADDISVVIVGL